MMAILTIRGSKMLSGKAIYCQNLSCFVLIRVFCVLFCLFILTMVVFRVGSLTITVKKFNCR